MLENGFARSRMTLQVLCSILGMRHKDELLHVHTVQEKFLHKQHRFTQTCDYSQQAFTCYCISQCSSCSCNVKKLCSTADSNTQCNECGCMQNLAEDWTLGSTGCYDTVSLAQLQSTLKHDFKAVALGNNDVCLSQPMDQEVTDHLVSETLKADAHSLGKLMADHTQVMQHQACHDNHKLQQRSILLNMQSNKETCMCTWPVNLFCPCNDATMHNALQADWRPVLPTIRIPCLNLVGSKTMCFNAAGVAYVGEHIPNCKTVSHMHLTGPACKGSHMLLNTWLWAKLL